MSQRVFIIGIAVLSLSIVAAAGLLASAQAQNKTQTAIISDDRAKTVTIIVNGEPQAVFDSGGLHVKGSISYGGTLTDDGGLGFRKAAGLEVEGENAP